MLLRSKSSTLLSSYDMDVFTDTGATVPGLAAMASDAAAGTSPLLTAPPQPAGTMCGREFEVIGGFKVLHGR